MTWQHVALLGLGLQIVGTVFAIRGLIETWRIYSTDALVPAWLQALRRRLPGPFRGPPPNVKAHPLTATASGKAYVTGTLSTNEEIQQQLRHLATAGVRTALVGILVILVGTVLQAPALL